MREDITISLTIEQCKNLVLKELGFKEGTLEFDDDNSILVRVPFKEIMER